MVAPHVEEADKVAEGQLLANEENTLEALEKQNSADLADNLEMNTLQRSIRKYSQSPSPMPCTVCCIPTNYEAVVEAIEEQQNDETAAIGAFVKIPPPSSDRRGKHVRDKSTKRERQTNDITTQKSFELMLRSSQEKRLQDAAESGETLGADLKVKPQSDRQGSALSLRDSQDNSYSESARNVMTDTEQLERFNGVFYIGEERYLFSKSSMNCMLDSNRLRQLCVKVIVNKWFDRLIILCIIANSLLLASKEYDEKYDVSYKSEWNAILDTLDIVFSVIFLVECILKIIGMGFIRHKQAYLRSAWNWIDFFIVIVSVIGFTPMSSDSSLKVFRTARILRPLRSMHQLKSMRRMLNTFFSSIPGLFNVCIFMVFIFTIFSIIAVNFFAGKQYQFCRETEELVDDGVNKPYWPINEDAGWQCSSDAMCSGNPNNLPEGKVAKCGDIYRDYGLDPVEFDDVYNNEMINFDITNFNSVLASSLTIFQVITLEGWSGLMYNYQDTVSYTTSSIFFVILIILGAFTTLNLVLAAIMHTYLEQEGKEKNTVDRDIQKKKKDLALKKMLGPTTSEINHNTSSLLAPNNNDINSTDPSKFEPIHSKRALFNENLSIIEENEASKYAHIESIGEQPSKVGDLSKSYLRRSRGSKGSRASRVSAVSIRKSIDSDQFKRSKNSKMSSNSSGHLPRLPGNSQLRFQGIMAHQDLEDRVVIDGAQISSLASFSERSHYREERTAEKHLQSPQNPKITSQKERLQFTESPMNKKYQTLPAKGRADDADRDSEGKPMAIFENSIASDGHQHQSPSPSPSPNPSKMQPVEVKFQAMPENDAMLPNAPPVATLEQRPNPELSIDESDLAEGYCEMRARRNSCYKVFYEIVISVTFNFLIYCFILANTITLALFRYDQSDEQAEVLNILNIVFVWVFFAEMVAKLIGLGMKNYSRDKFNVFDGLIVVVSLIDFTLDLTVDMGDSDGIMSAFRALRLLRVVKLARHWQAFQEILKTMISSLVDIANFSLLLLLMIFIFALLGMELFSFSAYEDSNGDLVFGQTNIQEAFERGETLTWPRQNFNNIFNSLVTVFIVIIAEDWNFYMYMYVRAMGFESEMGRTIAIFYFLIVFVVGNTIMLALFTALLLKSQAATVDELTRKIDEQEKKQAEKSLLDASASIKKDSHPCLSLRDGCSRKGCSNFYARFADSFVRVFGGDSAFKKRQKLRQLKDPRNSASPISGNAITPLQECQADSKNIQVFDLDPSPQRELLDPPPLKVEKSQLSSLMMNSQNNELALQRPHALLHYDFGQEVLSMNRSRVGKRPVRLRGSSLYFIKPENCLRKFCSAISTHARFDQFIIVLILLSTIALAFEHPLEDPQSEKLKVLEKVDLVFTAIFCLEAVLKIISLGFYLNGKRSYLRDPWNILDFIIVFFSLLSLGIDADLSVVKVLRVARILRPLRLIQRAEGLKIATMAFFKAIPQIMRLQVVIMFVIFMISILMTTLLSGKLFSCDLGHTQLSYKQTNLVTNKWDCLNYGGMWVTAPLNFDNTLQGMLTLFIFQTREGWVTLMENSVDAVGVDQVGQRGLNKAFIVIYMALVVVLCLLFVNMLIRIVIQTYNMQKDFISFNRLLSQQQRSWIQVQIMTYAVKPQVLLQRNSRYCLRNICIKIQQSAIFDNFIMVCILLNTVVMALIWFDQPTELPSVIEVLNYLFMSIFTFEAVIKLIALKKLYFRDSWNIFDFTIVAFTLIMLVLKLANVQVPFGNGPTILRALRIGRILRLIKKAKQLKIIFYTLLDSAPSLCSLGVLLIILFFMFAIIGRSMFGLTMINGPMQELNEHANFRDFTTSFLLLLRCSTGESWHMIMFDYAREYSLTYQCRENEDYESMTQSGGHPMGCGSPLTSYTFFILFNMLVFQVFINLFVAIIIDAFLGQTDHFNLPIQNYSIVEFVNIWAEFDPLATGYIDVTDLEQVVIRLAESRDGQELVIMRGQILKNKKMRRRYLAMLNIPTYSQLRQVMFYDVLQQICDKVNFYNFNKENIEAERARIKALKSMGIKGVKDELNLIMTADDQSSINFEKTVRNMGRLNPKIKLMLNLQTAFKRVHDKYAVYVDCAESMDLTDQARRALKAGDLRTRLKVFRGKQDSTSDLNLLTTRHYYAGLTVQKALHRALKRARNNLERNRSIGQLISNATPSEGATNLSGINSQGLDYADISRHAPIAVLRQVSSQGPLAQDEKKGNTSQFGQSRNSADTNMLVSEELQRFNQDESRNQRHPGVATLDDSPSPALVDLDK